MKKQIIYVAPPSKTIDKYAREVCQQLAQQIDSSYNAPGTHQISGDSGNDLRQNTEHGY